MNIAIPVSRHSKLLLPKPQSASYILIRHLSTEASPQQAPQKDDLKINQAVQLLLQNPHEHWPSNQPLHSLLFSSPSPSPRFLYNVTRNLASSALALNFLKHLQQNSPTQNTHFLSYPFQALVELAGRELDSGPPLFELYRASKEWGIPLTVNAAAILIRYLGCHKMVDESVVLFNELDPSLKNTHVRNVFINVLLRDGRLKNALNVLDEMLQPLSEVPPDKITGDIVLSALLKGDRKGNNFSEENIIKLVLSFGKHGVFPKTFWLTQMLSRLCRSGKINQAWNVLHELLTLRAPLETPPFHVLLTGLGRSGDIKRMNTLLAEMKESGIQPDVVTFGILINQLCKLRRVDDAMVLLNKLGEENRSCGVSISADVIMYNTVIDGLCKVGRQEEGLHLMGRMRSMKGLEPNIVTYNCLIDGFCKTGEIERGKLLFEQMNEDGISPNLITLNTLIDGMCRHGMINSALEFFNDMQGKGLKGNAVTYTTLITAYCNVDNIAKAVDLFDQMLMSGCSLHSKVCYSLISSLCKAGRMDDASNVLSKLKEAKFRPDIVCYNSLVSGFFKENMLNKAYDIINEMLEAGMKPDSVSYNTLITYFCKTGDFELAGKVMKQMINQGVIPTTATYGALIQAYCSNGKIKEAMKLFNDMSFLSKVPPNTMVYTSLIESLCKNNDIKGALSLMDDMKAKRVKPNTTTYNAVLKCLKENTLLEDAYRLMDGMIENACNPDSTTMEILRELLSGVDGSKILESFVQGKRVSPL
ncbi:proline iminopeptidase-like [Hibiscus syriacus]|uniref:Proline iminopeptidase-like n=1 Tax=Hibiscus syriacus TaxID=106335 RepID=A0A6A2XV25_HIBSY|nr:pentatricopeptide repeat-containing protein At3g61520, mitochondrial-like [Hibiscus syriacus]KAE8679532.1 proline iminopeptidase-like [Hibiscus syriacus]